MDKTIEIVIVAMVVLITATIVLFLVQDQTSSFDEFLGDQQQGAECDLKWQEYKSAVQCSPDVLEQEGTSIRRSYSDQCDQYEWTAYAAC